jgi:hypothetical protein
MMDMVQVIIWKRPDGGWCYQVGGQPEVYVYGTKRSVLNAVEKVLDKAYGIVKE